MDSTEGSPTRRLRCTIIGAGVSGILMACKIRMHLAAFVDFQILEKNAELGGTWQENRYPGRAAHATSQATATNSLLHQIQTGPGSRYATSLEIKNYLKAVARRFRLDENISYNRKVVSATWSDDTSTWTVQTSHGDTIESEILVNAGGILNNPQMPNIEGLDTFTGPTLHTAAWDSSVHLEGKTVAIIGSGASSIQVLPQLQAKCKHINVYIRTPSWICPPVVVPNAGNSNYTYQDEERELFREDEGHYIHLRKDIESRFNSMFGAFFKLNPEQQDMRNRFEARMRCIIKDEELQRRLIPSFEAGCRRINPGEQYLISIQEPNVEPVFDPIQRVTPTGIVAGGVEYPADVIVAATGFNTSFRPRFPIIGRKRVNLQDIWGKDPISYFGTGVSGFPNYLVYLGPNTPISNGSLMGPLEATSDYFIRLLQRMIRHGALSFDVHPGAQEDFDKHTKSFMKGMVWTGTCRSWFKRADDGKVTALWPGSSLHYMQCLAEDRWEDYEWRYDRERFAYWKNGFSWIERPGADQMGLQAQRSMEAMTTLPRSTSDLAFYIGKAENLSPSEMSSNGESPIDSIENIKSAGAKSLAEHDGLARDKEVAAAADHFCITVPV
ncbi:putative sterigmatocystin biosynthesis monooxygenase stcW [Metarhizium anisopliae]